MRGTGKQSPILGLIACASLLLGGSSAWANDLASNSEQTTELELVELVAQAEPGAPAEPTAEAREAIEEIIVTSRKREENILEIPESLTSFSEASIQRSNISSLSDISLLVPNLYMGRRTDGFPNVSIRGLGAFGNTQGVGFYVDDVQIFGDASGRFGDFERIEVLKGPQGILYGGTNIGGAVKYVLRRPNPEEFEGRIRVRAGEDDFYDGELVLNFPLAESWAARLYYYGESNDSFLDNPNSVRLSGRRNNNDSDPGEVHRYGARASVSGDITDRLSVYASVRYNEEDGYNDIWSREVSGRLRYNDKIDTTFNPEHYRETWGGSVELDYDFDDFTVTSITSRTRTDSERQSDIDITQEFILDLFRPHRIEVVTQELRFTSTGSGPFQWQVGGYYQEYDRDLNSDLGVFGGVLLNPFITEEPAVDPMDPDFLEIEELFLFPIVFERSKRERENLAGFASASYRWNDLEFAAGYRIDQWESKRENACPDPENCTAPPTIPAKTGSQQDTENLFRGSVAYFFDDDRSMAYVLYSQGFEPGDFNLTSFEGAPGLFGYTREKATNYEIGYKGRLLDDRVVLAAAVFRLDYKDRQIELQTRDPETGAAVEGILNVGDSRHWGYEADLQVFLHPDWTLSASFGYLDAEWKSGTRSPITGVSISGRTPLNASDWSATYALDYNREIDADTRLFGRLQVRQKGDAKTNAQLCHPAPGCAPGFDPDNDSFPIWENDGFAVADAHLGVGWQNWELGISVENIFDTEYYVDAQEFPNFAGPEINDQFDIVIGTLEQPRRVMGWVEYKF